MTHLREPGEGEQPTTAVELFFDLVYVFAVTQLSHLLFDDLTWAGAARTAFLLVVVWWAWIYTTWMVNWFDPDSTAVRLVLIGVMLASLLMAAALPEAFGEHGLLFAGAYVALQVGPQRRRRAAAAARTIRCARCSSASSSGASPRGALWIAGAAARRRPRGCCSGSRRWPSTSPRRWSATGPPGRGVSHDRRLRSRGRPLRRALPGVHHHRARRVDRRHRRHRGRRGPRPPRSSSRSRSPSWARPRCGGCTSARSPSTRGATSRESDDPGRLARDAYTYLHLPIVAGIILARGRRRAADRPPQPRRCRDRGRRDGARRAGRCSCSARASSGCG